MPAVFKEIPVANTQQHVNNEKTVLFLPQVAPVALPDWKCHPVMTSPAKLTPEYTSHAQFVGTPRLHRENGRVANLAT